VKRVTQEGLIRDHGLNEGELDELTRSLEGSCSTLKHQIQGEVTNMLKERKKRKAQSPVQVTEPAQATEEMLAPLESCIALENPVAPVVSETPATAAVPESISAPKNAGGAERSGTDEISDELTEEEMERILRVRFEIPPSAAEVSLAALPDPPPGGRPPYTATALCAVAIWSFPGHSALAKDITEAILARFPWFSSPEELKRLKVRSQPLTNKIS
jgi:hypothetical protein